MTMKELAVAISHDHVTLSDLETTNFTNYDRFIAEIVELKLGRRGGRTSYERSSVDF